MANIKITAHTKYGKDVERLELPYTAVGNVNGYNPFRKQFPKKLNFYPIYDLAILFFGGEKKKHMPFQNLNMNVHSSFMKQPKCSSTGKRKNKLGHNHPKELYSAIKH